MKQLLASQEVVHPRLFFSIRSALMPLMAISHTGENLNSLLKMKIKNTPLSAEAQPDATADGDQENSLSDEK